MSQPDPYNRQASFTTIQQEAPTDPLPGTDLDAELNAVKHTLDEVLQNLSLIQRDDGALANASVGREQLDASLNLGFNKPSAWLTATPYTTLDTVFQGGGFYSCEIGHTSGIFADDLAAGKWALIADLSGGGGAGSGDVTGPGGATIGHVAIFADATGKLLGDGGPIGALAAKSIVSTTDLAGSAVTYAKIQNVTTTARVLGRKTAGAGVVEELSLTDLLDLIGSVAEGDILYRGSTGWARLGAGTSGQFLKTQGAAANPIWADLGVGSGDVIGPATNTNLKVPQWNGNNSKTLQDGLAVGTAANDLVQLDASAKLPAVDGSQLTNLPAQPSITSSAFPIGAVVLLRNNHATNSVADGATVAGTQLDLINIFISTTDGNPVTATATGAVHPSGTWKNVSGYALNALGGTGYCVRVS